MSYSLKVKNGDLAIGNGRFLATVSGSAKLLQDIRLTLLEKRGTDPYHPEYGTMIDDATDQEVALLGRTADEIIPRLNIELDRIRKYYQNQQIARINADQVRFSRPTLKKEEILAKLEVVDAIQVDDVLKVSVRVSTVTGVTETINIEV